MTCSKCFHTNCVCTGGGTIELCSDCLRRRDVCNCDKASDKPTNPEADELREQVTRLEQEVNEWKAAAKAWETCLKEEVASFKQENERLSSQVKASQEHINYLCDHGEVQTLNFRDAMRLVHHLTQPFVDND